MCMTDLISKSALWNAILTEGEKGLIASRSLEEIIDEQPTIEAEPVRHGHWSVDEDGNIECSVCGTPGVGDNFCERCGAKMDEVIE